MTLRRIFIEHRAARRRNVPEANLQVVETDTNF